MNKKEACDILGIAIDASLDDIKKKYRDLSKKHHPDIDKSDGAEDRFKKINQAYQFITSNDPKNQRPQYQNPFGRQNVIILENIDIYTTISFQESVLGTKKDIKFTRRVKCDNCNGKGEISIHNGCTKCSGRGQITGRQGHIVFTSTCDQCFGKAQTEPCRECSDGTLEAETSVNVAIPAGIQDSNILRLSNMGHYAGSFMIMEQYTDVHLHVNVIKDPDLSLSGSDVVSNLDISLLEALQGCSKSVRTIAGDKQITIPALSKNREEIIIPKLGVAGSGSQKVILNVSYPKNINTIIDKLIADIKEA